MTQSELDTQDILPIGTQVKTVKELVESANGVDLKRAIYELAMLKRIPLDRDRCNELRSFLERQDDYTSLTCLQYLEEHSW